MAASAPGALAPPAENVVAPPRVFVLFLHAAQKCGMCGVPNVEGSTRQDVCSYTSQVMTLLQNDRSVRSTCATCRHGLLALFMHASTHGNVQIFVGSWASLVCRIDLFWRNLTCRAQAPVLLRWMPEHTKSISFPRKSAEKSC